MQTAPSWRCRASWERHRAGREGFRGQRWEQGRRGLFRQEAQPGKSVEAAVCPGCSETHVGLGRVCCPGRRKEDPVGGQEAAGSSVGHAAKGWRPGPDTCILQAAGSQRPPAEGPEESLWGPRPWWHQTMGQRGHWGTRRHHHGIRPMETKWEGRGGCVLSWQQAAFPSDL